MPCRQCRAVTLPKSDFAGSRRVEEVKVTGEIVLAIVCNSNSKAALDPNDIVAEVNTVRRRGINPVRQRLINSVADDFIRRRAKVGKANRRDSLDKTRIRSAEDVTKAETQLLELMLAHEEVRRAMASNLTEDDYLELATGAIFTAVIEIDRGGHNPDFDTLAERLEAEPEREMLPALLMSDLAWVGGDDFDTLFKKATEALSSLRKRKLERMLDAIQIEIGQAEREQNGDRVLQLYQQKTEIQRRRLALSAS